MDKGRERFSVFILDCVNSGEEDKAKALLMDCFKRQDEGRFTKADLESFHTELTVLLKPERRDEVLNIMTQFGGDHINK